MKSTIIAIAIVTSMSAMADTSLSVSGIRDTRADNMTGYNVTLTEAFAPDFKVSGAFENTAGVSGTNRDTFMLGLDADYVKYRRTGLAVLGKIGYSEDQVNKGAFVRFGAKVYNDAIRGFVPYIGIERQLGTSNINVLDTTEGFVGADYSLTKKINLNGKVTFGDGIPGAKYQGGVSYTF